MNLICVSFWVVDKHDAFPAEELEHLEEEQRKTGTLGRGTVEDPEDLEEEQRRRVEVGTDTCQHRELDQAVDGVVASQWAKK